MGFKGCLFLARSQLSCNQPQCPSWQAPRNRTRVKGDACLKPLIADVHMGGIMIAVIHIDNQSVESRQDRHFPMLASLHAPSQLPPLPKFRYAAPAQFPLRKAGTPETGPRPRPLALSLPKAHPRRGCLPQPRDEPAGRIPGTHARRSAKTGCIPAPAAHGHDLNSQPLCRAHSESAGYRPVPS